MSAGARRAGPTRGALLRAVESLGIGSVAVVTPYPDEVGDRLVAFLGEAGVEVAEREEPSLHLHRQKERGAR